MFTCHTNVGMSNWRKNRIESAIEGKNPTVLVHMKSGIATLGDTQFLPGYCVLLAYPQVEKLNDLSIQERAIFLTDMTIIGDAIENVYRPLKINYDILGNEWGYLHAHILPRYEWEEEYNRKRPSSSYSVKDWYKPEYLFPQKKFEESKRLLMAELTKLMKVYYGLEKY